MEKPSKVSFLLHQNCPRKRGQGTEITMCNTRNMKEIQTAPNTIQHYALVDFYCHSRKRQVNENTIALQRTRLNTILNDWVLNDNVIVQDNQLLGVSGLTVQLWCNRWSETRTPATMNNYISFLNGFLYWAYQIGSIQGDFSKILRCQKRVDPDTLPEDERPVEKFYSHEEVEALVRAIEESQDRNWLRDRAMITLILFSGLRREEVSKLTIKQVRKYGKGKIYCQRKGEVWKMVDVSEEWYKYLLPYLESRGPLEDSDPLFTVRKNDPISKMGIYEAIRKYQDRLNLVRGSHVLRHVFISEVEKVGGIAVARDCANHKHIRITEQYDHTTADQRQAAVNCLKYFTCEM